MAVAVRAQHLYAAHSERIVRSEDDRVELAGS